MFPRCLDRVHSLRLFSSKVLRSLRDTERPYSSATRRENELELGDSTLSSRSFALSAQKRPLEVGEVLLPGQR